MIRLRNFFFFTIIFFIISSCTTNTTYTKKSQDIRQVDVFNQNKKLVKTYYQKFNSKVAKWLNVTCVFTNNKVNRNKLRNLDECKFTNLSKSIINNKNKETDQNFSNKDFTTNNNDYNNQNESLNENENENLNDENQSHNPGELPEENHSQQFENCNDPRNC